MIGFSVIWWIKESLNEGSDVSRPLRAGQKQSSPVQQARTVSAPPTYEDRLKFGSELLRYRELNVNGKVIDEKGSPVSGAMIGFGVSRGYNQGNYGSTTTDDKGNFSITGQTGHLLSFHAEHPDYITTEKSDSLFDPMMDWPNPKKTKDVTLILRKKLPEQNLIERRDTLRFNFDGASGVVYYDLKSGSLVPVESASTLRVRMISPPMDTFRPSRYTWSVTVEVPFGSVFKKTDPYLFEAPAEGYQDSIQVIEHAGSHDWDVAGELSLFVKLRTGEFGMTALSFDSRDGRARIFSSSLNPERGNRNLTPKSEQ